MADQKDVPYLDEILKTQRIEYAGKVPSENDCLLRQGKLIFTWLNVKLIVANSKLYLFSDNKVWI